MSDELGFNKIAGAILATALAYMGIKELAHAAYHPHAPEVPAYGADLLAEAMKNTGKSDAAAEPLPFPQPSYVAAMDPAAGEKVFAKCKSCHSIEQGGANATGPNLYGILNNPIGAQDGFGYSAAFKATDLNWGYEELDAYLAKPRSYIKGTAMSFVGLKKEDQRAAVIAYLRSYGDENVPLPTPAVVEDAAEPAEAMPTDAIPSDASVVQEDPMESAAIEAPEAPQE